MSSQVGAQAESLRTGLSESAKAATRPDLLSEIYRLLDEIHDPCSVATSNPMGLVEMGIIKDVEASPEGHVCVQLRLTSPFCEMLSYMKSEAIRKITALEAVSECEVRHDSGLEWDHDMMSPAAKQRRQLRLLSARDRSESFLS